MSEPVLSDADAGFLIDNWQSIPPDRIGRARERLSQYKSVQDQLSAQRGLDLEKMWVDGHDKWIETQPDEVKQSWERVTDPAAEQRIFRQTALLSEVTRTPPQVIAKDPVRYREAVAKAWNQPEAGLSEEAFDALAKSKITDQRNRRLLFDGARKMGAASAAWEGSGLAPEVQPTYAAWQEANSNAPGYNIFKAAEYEASYWKAKRDHEVEMDRLRPQIDAVWNLLTLGGERDEAPSIPDYDTLAQLLMKLPREDVERVKAVIHARANLLPKDVQQGFWTRAGEMFDRMWQRAASGMFYEGPVLATAAIAEGVAAVPSPAREPLVGQVADARRQLALFNDLRTMRESEIAAPGKGSTLDSVLMGGVSSAPGVVIAGATSPWALAGQFAGESFDTLRAQMETAGMPAEEAEMWSGRLAPVAGTIMAAIEKATFGLAKGPLGALQRRIVTHLAKGAWVKRTAAGLGVEVVEQFGQEVIQQAIPAIVQDTADVLGVPVPDANVMAALQETATDPTTLGVSIMFALGGFAVSPRGQLPSVHRARLAYQAGFQDEHIDAVVAARTDEELITAVKTGFENRKPPPSAASNAAAEGYENRNADIISIQRDSTGWWLNNKDGTRTQADSSVAALSLRRDLQQVKSAKEAEAMVAVADFWVQLSRPAAEREVGREHRMTFSGEIVQVTREGDVIKMRNGSVVVQRVVGSELDNTRRQMALLDEQEGTQEVTALAMGSNEVQFRQKVAADAGRLVDVLETTINVGKGVLTQVHEMVEAMWKHGIANGTVTVAESVQAIRSLERAIGKSLLKEGQEADTVAVRELIAELGVADVVARRKDGSKLPAGAISQGVEAAIANAMKPDEMRALGKFRAFLRATKEWFRATFKTVAAVAKAKRDGKLKPDDDWHRFIEKLLGLDEQVAHNVAVATDVLGVSEAELREGVAAPAAAGKTFSMERSRLFEPKDWVVKQWNRVIDRWAAGEDLGRELISLGPTSPVLQASGAKERIMAVAPGLLNKVTRERHAVPVSALRALPESLAAPLAVFPSRTEADSIVVLTEYREAGEPIIASVRLDKQAGRGLVINEVTSFYGRPAADIQSMFGEAPIYIDKQRSLDWARRAGLQLPGRGTPSQGQSRVLGPEDVVKRFTGETMSLASAEFLETIARTAESRQLPPEERRQTWQAIAEDIAGMARAVRHNDSLQPILKLREIEEERKKDFTQKFAELIAKGVKEPEARAQARKESNKDAAEARITAQREAGKLDRREMLRALAVLDSIVMKLPPEVRATAGGFTALARLTTNEAREKYLREKIAKLDDALERHLKREFAKDFRKLLERAEPKREPGEKPKGKLTAEVHAWFDQVRAAASMTEAAVETRMNEIEGTLTAAGGTPLTPEQELALVEEYQVLQVFGAIEKQSSQEIASAIETAKKMFAGGRQAWQVVLEERKAEWNRLREQAKKEVDGGEGLAALSAGAEKRVAKRFKTGVARFAWFGNTFEQTMQAIFGRLSKTAKHFVDLARHATRAARDEMLDAEDQFVAALKAMGLKTRIKRMRYLNEFTDMDKGGEVTLQPTKRIESGIATELAERIFTGKMTGHGYSVEEVAAMQAAYDENLALEKPRENITFERVVKGKASKIKISRAMGAHILMTYGQERYRAGLEEHGIDEQTIAEIQEMLQPEDRLLMAWIADQYEQGHGGINDVFKRMEGIDLPKERNYSPGIFEHEGDLSLMNIEGPAVQNGSIASGFLRGRKKHKAMMKLDFEEGSINLLSVFQNSVAQKAHWKAWAEVVRDMKATFKNAEVRTAISAKHGDFANFELQRWIENFENNGLRAGYENMAMGRWMRRLMKAKARTGLIGKLSVLGVQSTASFTSALDLPAREAVRSFVRVLTGTAVAPPGDIRKYSPAIQRRLHAGISPEQRMARTQAGESYGVIEAALDAGMEAIGVVDAYFTAISAAAAYDAHYRDIKRRDPDISEADARNHAEEQMTATVERTAQPSELMERSLFEAQANPWARLFFMFVSEPRQKLALEIAAVRHLTRRELPTSEMIKVVVINHLLWGGMAWTVRSIIRDLMNDEDDDDDPAWEWEEFALAVAMGPLAGVPLFGEAVEATLRWLFGLPVFHDSINPAVENLTQVADSFRSMFRGPRGKEKHEPIEHYIKHGARVMQALSILVASKDARAAIFGVLANMIDQMFRLGDNTVQLQSEGNK